MIGKGDVESVSKIIDENKDLINTPAVWGHTPLSMSVECDSKSMARFFCNNGADVNATITLVSPASGRKSEGMTAIMFSKSPSVIELLVKSGADVNARDTKGRSVLFNVGMLYNTELLDCLISQGATLDKNEIIILLNAVTDELSFRSGELNEKGSVRIMTLKNMESWCFSKINRRA